MAKDREDRHWKIARADLCASATEATRIAATLHAVARETSPGNRPTPSVQKGSSFLSVHHVRLTTFSILNENGCHPPFAKATARQVDRRYSFKLGGKVIRPSLPSRARSSV